MGEVVGFRNRRTIVRGVLHLAATIESVAGRMPMRCSVVDLTLKGARLEAEGIALPAEFTLALQIQSLLKLRCQVVWRNGFSLGVRFLSAAKHTTV